MVAIGLDKMASIRTLVFVLLFCSFLIATFGSPVEKHERLHSKDGKFHHRRGHHHNLNKNLDEKEKEAALNDFIEKNDSRKDGKHHKQHQNHHSHRNLAKAVEEETMMEFLEENGITKEEFLKYVALKASRHSGKSNFVMPRKMGNCGPGMKMDPLGVCRPVWSS